MDAPGNAPKQIFRSELCATAGFVGKPVAKIRMFGLQCLVAGLRIACAKWAALEGGSASQFEFGESYGIC